MRILGIDPGTTTTGFAFLDLEGGRLKLIDCGVISTQPKKPLPAKLVEIYSDIKKLIKKYKPDCLAIEQLFFFKNAKTAFLVGQARGVILLAAHQFSVPISEYSPLQVKMATTSNGRADKKQVQRMVKIILGLDRIPKPDDAADAVAVAICCANSQKIN